MKDSYSSRIDERDPLTVKSKEDWSCRLVLMLAFLQLIVYFVCMELSLDLKAVHATSIGFDGGLVTLDALASFDCACSLPVVPVDST